MNEKLSAVRRADWLVGGGEMGDLIRQADWSRTPLGAMAVWPESLRTSLGLCLSSPLPLAVLWGAPALQFANDAYRDLVGPGSFTEPGEAFTAASFADRPAILSAAAQALRGRAVTLSEQRLQVAEEESPAPRFVTVTFSPIQDPAGKIVGVLHSAQETVVASDLRRHLQTEQALRESERTQRLLAEIGVLGAHIGPINPGDGRPLLDELIKTICDRVATELGVPRCGLNRVEFEIGDLKVQQENRHALVSRREKCTPTEFSGLALEDGLTGRTTVIEEISDSQNPTTQSASSDPHDVRAYVNVPLLREKRWVGNFWVSSPRPRNWTDREVELVQTIADRIWLVVEQARLSSALRESEARARIAQQAAQWGVFEYDFNNDKNIWSPELEALYGLAPGTFEGSYSAWRKRLHPDDLERVERTFEQALELGEYSQDYRVVWDDGSVHWLFARAKIFHDAQGRPSRMLGVNVDITERKNAEEKLRNSQMHLRLTTEAARIGTWQWNVQTSELIWSRIHKELFGYEFSKETLRFEHWTRAVFAEDVPRAKTAIQDCLNGEPEYELEYRITRQDNGQIRWIRSTGRMEFNGSGKAIWMQGVSFDITEQKQAEEELQRLNADLRETDRRKDEFLATLAHELRNPLAPIRHALSLLNMTGDDPQMFAETREMMSRQLEQMVRLIDDLLDVSRITRGKIRLRREMMELQTAAKLALESARPWFDEPGHELQVSLPAEPLFVEADPTRLSQILSNLLSNAAKYTDPGGRIWLTIERHGNEAIVSVRDSGIGVSAEHLPRLFDMFSQETSALERSQGGLGIGLALVKGFVEMHGGTVSARSAGPGKGTEFIVRLPAADLAEMAEEVAEDAPTNAAEPPAANGALRILVVDDNVDSADCLAMILRLTGHVVETAHDGLAALEAAETFRPQVVLLDIGMPKLNGYEVARRVRQEPWGKETKLIAMTGWGQDEDKRRALEAGFDHHLTKPVDSSALDKLLVLERT